MRKTAKTPNWSYIRKDSQIPISRADRNGRSHTFLRFYPHLRTVCALLRRKKPSRMVRILKDSLTIWRSNQINEYHQRLPCVKGAVAKRRRDCISYAFTTPPSACGCHLPLHRGGFFVHLQVRTYPPPKMVYDNERFKYLTRRVDF